MNKIPDISEWQGNINFKKLLPTINAIIIRIQAGSTHLDTMAKRNIETVSKSKVPYMIYAYHYGLNPKDSEQEAINAYNRTVKYVKGANGKMPKAFIIDDEEDTSNNQLKSCQAWINKMKKLSKLPVGFYTYTSRYTYKRYSKIKADFLWLANYSNEPTIKCDLWQNSDKTKFNGITNPCDSSTNISKKLSKILNVKTNSVYTSNSTYSGFTKERGTFTIKVKGGIAVHNRPILNSKITGYLMPDESIKYDGYKNADGYTWVHYLGTGNVDLFLPTHPTGSKNNVWGVFS